MDALGTTTLSQLPIWPLVLGSIALGLLSVVVGVLPAVALSMLLLWAMTWLPATATVTIDAEQVSLRGWMGLPPLPRVRTLPRAGLIASRTTYAGEGEDCVHTLVLTNADRSVRMAGIRCSPGQLSQLVDAMPLAVAPPVQA
jgi:hypothetical protein